MTPGAVRKRTERDGPWRRLLPGVYLTVTGAATADQLQIAALLYAGSESVLTGVAALARLGVRGPATDKLTVLVPASRPHHSASFVAIWPTTRMPPRHMYDGVIRYALPNRAAADAARELTSLADIRATVADAVQQRWCTIDGLADELRFGPRRGSAPLRTVLAEVAAGARSVAEADLLRLLKAARIAPPFCNPLLYSGREFIAKPDMWWPDAGVAVEVDSRAWHLLPEHASETTRRHNRMSARGITVMHFSPRQIRDEPSGVVAEIKAALIAGRARPRLPLRTVPAS